MEAVFNAFAIRCPFSAKPREDNAERVVCNDKNLKKIKIVFK
jgi:hypothetical protein